LKFSAATASQLKISSRRHRQVKKFLKSRAAATADQVIGLHLYAGYI
jgi:hypothetical protein